MRTGRTILAIALALGLLVGATVAPASAQDATNETATNETTTDASTASGTNSTAEGDDNETSDGPTNPWARYVRNLTEARKAALDAFKENRSAAAEEFRAEMTAIRESYLENKTRVIDECRADGAPDMANATKEEKLAFAQCVRDGLRPLKEEARAAIDAAKDGFREEMKAARAAILDGFREAREQGRAQMAEERRAEAQARQDAARGGAGGQGNATRGSR